MFKAAAVNGNVDILQYAVSSGHDHFPLVWIKKRKKLEDYYNYEDDDDSYDDNGYYYGSVVCDSAKKESVDTSKIIERGHIHVLKYLKEELNHHWGLQKYCVPAIQHGQLEILNWLKNTGRLKEDEIFN